MAIKLKNPTDNLVFIVIEDERYEIEAGGTIEVEEKVAAHWMKIHGFLQAVVEEAAPKAKKEESKPKKSTKKEEDAK